ncbi:hypothetical protein OIU84_018727 [Salix udensis]|uniref:Uncharacterized protein n=1 Tax=Salix udensis TaxID=889485 RepID=A0AAD6PK53_9ROSI|nr:hypothetical protein OIU84_018727 [Salix udensis]
MQITYLLVLFVGVVVLAAPSFADYYKGPKYVPRTPYSKPPQVEKPFPDIWIPKIPKRKIKPPKLPKFKFSPPPPSRKRLPPYRHYPGHPPAENAQYIKPNN